MGKSIVIQVIVGLLVCAPVYSFRAPTEAEGSETGHAPLCHWPGEVHPWRSNPLVLEYLTPPRGQVPLERWTEPAQTTVAAPSVPSESGGSCVRRCGSAMSVLPHVPRHSLLSVLCILIV